MERNDVRTPRRQLHRKRLRLVATCTFVFALAMFVWFQIHAEVFIRFAPVSSAVVKMPDGTLRTKRITFCVGKYGVSEFGNIRLAFRGCTFRGESSGELVLANNRRTGGNWGISLTEVGNVRFTNEIIPGGSRCTFGDLTFEIRHGALDLLGQSFDVTGRPLLLIVDTHGRLESVNQIAVF